MKILIIPRACTPASLRNIACAIALFGLSCMAVAQTAAHMRFTRLPNLVTADPTLVSMLQDRQGFIWLGALGGGLYRYDGGRILKFVNDPKNPNSLPAERVNALFEDKLGRIWAGTAHGLARFNPENSSFTRYVSANAPGKHQVIRKIISDGANGMWLGTWGGLQHFDPASGKFTLYKSKKGDTDSIASDSVESLALDARRGLWIATWPTGLDYLPPGSDKFQHFQVGAAGVADPLVNQVAALQMDGRNRLWIGTRRGVYRWNDGSDWSERSRVPSPNGQINNFYPASDGGMWAVTMTDGVLRWTGASEEPVNYLYRPNDPYSLPTLSLQSVMQDRSGLLWVGSYNAGILVANPGNKGFSRIIPPELPFGKRQPNNTTTAIAAAPEGRLWMAGLTGIALLNPATGEVDKYYRAEAGSAATLTSDTVYSVYQRPGGPLWIGSINGLSRLDMPAGPVTPIVFPDTTSANNAINSISPGANGKLWLSTNGRVIQYDPASGEHRIYQADKDNPKGRQMQRANWVLEDKLGRVWMGSEYADGLDMLDQRTGAFQHFLHDDSVAGLHEDDAGRLWAGTTKGLNEILTAPDGKISFRYFPGAGDEKIFSVQSERSGKVWLTTSDALIRLDPASGKASRYTAADGLLDGYRVGSRFTASDGSLYFGGTTGIISVRPEQAQSDASRPLVAITDISVMNRSLALAPHPAGVELSGSVTAPGKLVLPSAQSAFSIEFAALHFADPSSNSYAYQLEGFDRAWIDVDAAHRSASYTNLDPGQYRFKVKAANNAGVWNEQGASLAITILPPFWESWWFRLLSFALTITLLALAYRLRVRTLNQHKRELEAEVALRTRELAESNAKLAELSLTDGLTGLTNRRGFDAGLADAWARALRSGEPVALAMLDVDHFKLYNDEYGHQAGDQCLREVANVIAAHARRPGDVAARYGGEEFALLPPSASGPDALRIAQSMCDRLAAKRLPHVCSSFGFVSVSIGVVSLVPGPENSMDLLIRLADNALYRAKHEGRNRAVLATSADILEEA
ncbi:MAG: diguanylate cyclase [Pseudomonadota bacterium]